MRTFGYAVCAGALALLMLGCGGLQVGPLVVDPAGGAVIQAAEGGAGPAYAPGDDIHWMQADDWFFAAEVPETGWYYTRLGKLKVAASPATKGQAQFFDTVAATDVWANWYVRTRPAVAGDFVLGNTLICFEGNNGESGYGPPTTKSSARTAAWFAAKVTDTSDAFKGIYRVETYNVRLGACRALVK